MRAPGLHGIINIDKKLIIDDRRDAIYRVSDCVSIAEGNANITDAINPDAINRVSTVKQIGDGVAGNNTQCGMKIYHVLFIGKRIAKS